MFNPFDTNGNIQPGIHYYTYEMFKKQFVDDISDSKTRVEIHHLSFLWLAQLERVVTPIEIWVDGDFISQNKNPSGIDLCVFLLRTNLSFDVISHCMELSNQSRVKFKCNTYFGMMNEDGTLGPLGPYYWTEQFGFDSLNTPKGIVVLPWEEVSTALK